MPTSKAMSVLVHLTINSNHGLKFQKYVLWFTDAKYLQNHQMLSGAPFLSDF